MKKGFGVFLLLVSFALIGSGTYFMLQDKEFTVTFTGVDGMEPVIVKNNSYVKKPTDPKKIGSVFTGWYYNNELFDFNSKITKDITLEARWKADSTVGPTEPSEFTITFNNDDGTLIKTVKVSKGQVATKIEDPVKEGYKFVGWYNGLILYDFNLEVTTDLILTAKFEANKKITVTFNSDGGSSIEKQLVDEGKVLTKPANPTKNGYTFVSWQLNGKDYDFKTPVTADITLKATWKKNSTAVKKYTVKFDSKGGTAVSSQTVEDGKTATKPNSPTRAGYTFLSWQLNGKDYDFSKKVTGNITLVAVWKANATYTVTFNSNGGSKVSSQSVTGGFKITKPADPTRENYNFKGWYLNDKEFNFNTPITSNITLIAKWEEKE